MVKRIDVYSRYDNAFLMNGTIAEVGKEFLGDGQGLSSIYKMNNKISKEKDWYTVDEGKPPIKHDVLDIYDTDTWEYITTVVSFQQAVTEGYFKSNYSAMMNSRGTMQRRAYGGYRIQKRNADDPIPKSYTDRLPKSASRYIATALLK